MGVRVTVGVGNEEEMVEDPIPRPRAWGGRRRRRRRRRRGWFRKAVRKVKKLPSHIKKWHDRYQKYKGVLTVLGDEVRDRGIKAALPF